MRVTLLSLFLMLSQVCIAQQQDIKTILHKLYVIKSYTDDGEKRINFEVNRNPNSTNPYYTLLKEYDLYLDYFLFNTTNLWGKDSIYFKNVWPYYSDSIEYYNHYITALSKDAFFTECISEMARDFVNSNQPVVQREIEINEMMHTAALFFYADKQLNDTTLSWHICVGLNPFRQENKASHNIFGAFLEAFCFNAIMKDADTTNTIYNHFTATSDKAQVLMLKYPVNQRLHFAREYVYDIMVKDEDLKKMLINSYEKQRDMLPFKLVHTTITIRDIRN